MVQYYNFTCELRIRNTSKCCCNHSIFIEQKWN